MQISEKDFNDEVNKILAARDIEWELSEDWYDIASKAFCTSSPLVLGISGQQMGELYRKVNIRQPLNYMEFAILNNMLETKSAADLKIKDMDEYFNLMTEVGSYAQRWNEFGKSVHNQVMNMLIERNTKNKTGLRAEA